MKKEQNPAAPPKDIKGFKHIDYTQTRFHTMKTTTQPPKAPPPAPTLSLLSHNEVSNTSSVFVPKTAMITQKLNELQLVQKNNQQMQEELQRQHERAQREQLLQQEEQRKQKLIQQE